MKKYFLVIKFVISVLLFYMSLQYEQASPERSTTLIILFTIYLSWGGIRTRMSTSFWLFFIDGLLLLLLDYQSRFVVNYFIHSLYFLLIIEAGLVLKRNYLNLTIIPIIFVALSKYIYLLYFQLNARSLSETFFHLFALLFVLSLFHYLQLQKEEQAKNELLYKELLATHRQLKRYMKEAEKMTLIEERNRIGREMHDSVGHELTALLMLLEISLLKIKEKNTVKDIEVLLQKAKETAKSCLAATRNAVYAMKDDNQSFLEATKSLVEKLKHDHLLKVNVKLDPNLEELQLTEEQNINLYRIFQEALTNVMRHGATKQVSISIQQSEKECLIFQIDNRIVSDDWQVGFGIANMQDRLERLGGTLKVVVKDCLFILKGELPLTRGEKHD